MKCMQILMSGFLLGSMLVPLKSVADEKENCAHPAQVTCQGQGEYGTVELSFTRENKICGKLKEAIYRGSVSFKFFDGEKVKHSFKVHEMSTGNYLLFRSYATDPETGVSQLAFKTPMPVVDDKGDLYITQAGKQQRSLQGILLDHCQY